MVGMKTEQATACDIEGASRWLLSEVPSHAAASVAVTIPAAMPKQTTTGSTAHHQVHKPIQKCCIKKGPLRCC